MFYRPEINPSRVAESQLRQEVMVISEPGLFRRLTLFKRSFVGVSCPLNGRQHCAGATLHESGGLCLWILGSKTILSVLGLSLTGTHSRIWTSVIVVPEVLHQNLGNPHRNCSGGVQLLISKYENMTIHSLNLVSFVCFFIEWVWEFTSSHLKSSMHFVFGVCRVYKIQSSINNIHPVEQRSQTNKHLRYALNTSESIIRRKARRTCKSRPILTELNLVIEVTWHRALLHDERTTFARWALI